jgi:CheY-like chemotaxis protein
VVLSVADDGRGIDLEAVRRTAVRRGVLTAEQAADAVEGELLDLLFSHGFSTRERAGELSGRGVGLDAMRGAVEALGGFVTLSTELGKGTRFSLTVPTSISKEAAVITEVAGSSWAVPSRYVLEVVRIADQSLSPAARGEGLVFPFRGEDVPLVSLAELLAPGGASMRRVDRVAAVVDAGVGRVALGLPMLVGERELVRRAVDPVVAAVGYLAGSATLDDGRLVLILLLPGLLRMASAIAERGSPASSSAAPRVPVAARTRVLVVDDSPIVCELVAELLEAAGLAPRTALGGRAALELLGTQSFEVVLTDLDMPGMDGLELLERIRAGWPALPVVVLSARERPSELARATDLGAAAFLAKSEFHTATLVQTLRKVAKSG